MPGAPVLIAVKTAPPESAWEFALRVTPTLLPLLVGGFVSHAWWPGAGLSERLALGVALGLGSYLGVFLLLLAAYVAGAFRGAAWRRPLGETPMPAGAVAVILAVKVLGTLAIIAVEYGVRHTN